MKKLRAALIDLSGTLHVENAATSNAQSALQRLRSTGVKIKFVTNTTKESKCSLCQRLRSLSFDIAKDEIFTSLTAARRFVQARSLRPMLLLEKSAQADFEGVDTRQPNAVLIGLAPSKFNYSTMNMAFRLLVDGAPLIAVHKARYFRVRDGLSLGPGGFVSALEYAADTEAVVLGKPQPEFFRQALSEVGCEATPGEVVMIGDDFRDDVEGAVRCGMSGVLVKTGKYRDEDENKMAVTPTAVCQDFSDAVKFVCENFRLPNAR